MQAWQTALDWSRKHPTGKTFTVSFSEYPKVWPKYSHNCEIRIKDTVSCAIECCKAGDFYGKVAILNFANSEMPGLEVETNTQEEDILKRTNLSYSLCDSSARAGRNVANKQLYPIIGSDVIYTSNVIPMEDPSVVFDVITSAAVEYPYNTEHMVAPYYDIMKEKIHTIFMAAQKNNVNTLILGAYGCGAFACPPKSVAKLFRETIPFYPTIFRNVFALFPDMVSIFSRELM